MPAPSPTPSPTPTPTSAHDSGLRRASDGRFRSVFDVPLVGIVIWTADGELTDANDAFLKMVGYTREELLRGEVRWLELSPPEYAARDAQAMQEFLTTGTFKPYEKEYLRKDGTRVPVFIGGSNTSRLSHGGVAVVFDLTERLRVESELRESEERFRQLAEVLPSVLWSRGLGECAVTYVNEAYETIWGRSRESLYADPDSWLESIHVDDRARVKRAIEEEALSGARGDRQYRIVRPDGTTRWISDRAFPMRNERGEVERVVGIAEDMTVLKNAEGALQGRELYFRSLIENAQDMVSVLDIEGKFRYSSPSTERVLGYRPDELIGRDALELVHPDDLATVAEHFREGILVPAYSERMEYRYRHKDGSWRTVEAAVTNLLMVEAVKGVIVNSRDVTERKRSEEALHDSEAQLRQSLKMEAVGRLAGGIAHDFNNLLTAIIGYGDLAVMGLRAGDPLRADIEEILKAAGRAATLTRQLLAFSRKQVLEPTVLDLNHIVSGMASLLQRVIGEDIKLATITASTWLAKADAGQLEQVIMNLAVNARDAMATGGALTIETSDDVLDESYVSAHLGLRAGPYVCISVSDTGCGMSADMRSHLFEPFFTTKAPGKGTGLGLPTVYGIVQQSQGHIAVYSEVGRGSTFKVYLPRAMETVATPSAPSPAPGGLRGSETVLLVEDDDVVRDLARRALESFGYRTLVARGGGEALMTSESHGGPIEIMVTDVIMPDLDGPSLATRLAPLRPEMRVLFMSGYTAGAIERHGVLNHGVAFLPKPFSPVALARKVRETLDAAPARAAAP